MQVITPYQRSPHWLLSIVTLLLIGCATVSKLDVSRVNSLATPNEVARQPDSAIGKTVQWGGEIIAVINRRDSTEVQVLAYPLYSDGSPNRELDAIGRFLVVYRGYLEPLDYAAGRLLTVVGTVSELRADTVGQAGYRLPVIQAEQLYLWPKHHRSASDTLFGIGIGIGIGL
jgi:outer membrane lipoprotein